MPQHVQHIHARGLPDGIGSGNHPQPGRGQTDPSQEKEIVDKKKMSHSTTGEARAPELLYTGIVGEKE